MSRSLINSFSFFVVLLSLDYLLPIWHAEAGVISLTKEEANSANELSIANCRQGCFKETMHPFFHDNFDSPKSIESCHQNPNCFMCFDYCRVLTVAVPGLAQSMCDDKEFCSKGCRAACDFYSIKSIDRLIYKLVNNP